MSRSASSRRGGFWGRVCGAWRGRPEHRGGKRQFRPDSAAGTRLEPRELPSAAVARPHPGARPALGGGPGVVIDQPDATIVLPPNLQPGKTYPLVVAFSYNGRPIGTQYDALAMWRTLGPQLGWIVYASKQYGNPVFHHGPAVTRATAQWVMQSLQATMAKLPVDPTRIILTGMSGGGNFAEYMNLTYPGFAAAIIDNSGRIPFELFGSHTPGVGALPGPQAFGNSRRVAVLLASPSDSEFYGDAVRADVPYYQQAGWQTLFVSFPGGHVFAPFGTYLQLAQWMKSRPTWR